MMEQTVSPRAERGQYRLQKGRVGSHKEEYQSRFLMVRWPCHKECTELGMPAEVVCHYEGYCRVDILVLVLQRLSRVAFHSDMIMEGFVFFFLKCYLLSVLFFNLSIRTTQRWTQPGPVPKFEPTLLLVHIMCSLYWSIAQCFKLPTINSILE